MVLNRNRLTTIPNGRGTVLLNGLGVPRLELKPALSEHLNQGLPFPSGREQEADIQHVGMRIQYFTRDQLRQFPRGNLAYQRLYANPVFTPENPQNKPSIGVIGG